MASNRGKKNVAELLSSTAAKPEGERKAMFHAHNSTGDYKEGDALFTIEAARPYYRAMREALLKKSDPEGDVEDIPNEALDAILTSVSGDNADAENARLDALINWESAPLPDLRAGADIAMGTDARALAYHIGAKFDKQMCEHLTVGIESKEKWDGTIYQLITDIDRLEKAGAWDTSTWPRPNTWKPGTEQNKNMTKDILPDGSNELADHWQSGKEKGTFVASSFDQSPAGHDIALAVSLLKMKSEERPGNWESELRRITGETCDLRNSRSLKAVKNRWNTRRNNGINRWRVAIQYIQQRARMKKLPGYAGIHLTDSDKPETKRNPFTIAYIVPGSPKTDLMPQGTIGYSEALSIGQINRFDVDEAYQWLASNPTWNVMSALEKTVEREPRTTTLEKVNVTPSLNEAVLYMEGLQWFLEDAASRAELFKWLNASEQDDGSKRRALISRLRYLFQERRNSIAKLLEQDQAREESKTRGEEKVG